MSKLPSDVNFCEKSENADMDSEKTVALVIGNKEWFYDFVSSSLPNKDYKLFIFHTGSRGVSYTSILHPDFIILHDRLPDMPTIEFIQRIRNWSNVPILVLSKLADEEDRIQALDYGADDFIMFPVSEKEFICRVRNILFHTRLPLINDCTEPDIYKAGDLRIDFNKKLIKLEKSTIHLTKMEYRLLTLLARHSGQVLSYNFIAREIWGTFSKSNIPTLRVGISNIRRKLEPVPSKPKYIFTENGAGYRMIENELQAM